MNNVFLFSGQGSQYFHMGHELYQTSPVFRGWMQRLDSLAAELCGESVLSWLYDPGRVRGEPCERTLFTHPAIFMVQTAAAQTLRQAGVVPQATLGVSMGAFAAAVAADAVAPEDALVAVIRQAQTLEATCSAGGLLAVLAEVDTYSERETFEGSELAAVNSRRHFVVSGASDVLRRIERSLRVRHVPCQRLPVTVAFHSRHIDEARAQLMEQSAAVPRRPPCLPFACARSAELLTELPADYFWSVVREPIQFRRAVEVLEARGSWTYVDVGPSGTLAGLLKYVLPTGAALRTRTVISPYGVTELARTCGNARSVTSVVGVGQERAMTEISAFVFPGQGSQQRGMGRELFESVPEYVALEPQVDAIVGYSLKRLCLENPDNLLKETRYTQPALYVVNALHYYRAVASGRTPAFLAGHSLGEYNALLAAGVFDFLTGLRLVKKRGELMSQARNGSMAAVGGLSAEVVARVIREHGLKPLDIANYNSPTQTIIAGPVDDITRAESVFRSAGAVLYMPLPVSAAFHSRYMSAPAREFRDFLLGFEFRAPLIPVIANVTAEPYGTEERPTETVRELLVRQMSESVLWDQSIRFLLSRNVTVFQECGPGNVLMKLIEQVRLDNAARRMPPSSAAGS